MIFKMILKLLAPPAPPPPQPWYGKKLLRVFVPLTVLVSLVHVFVLPQARLDRIWENISSHHHPLAVTLITMMFDYKSYVCRLLMVSVVNEVQIMLDQYAV